MKDLGIKEKLIGLVVSLFLGIFTWIGVNTQKTAIAIATYQVSNNKDHESIKEHAKANNAAICSNIIAIKKNTISRIRLEAIKEDEEDKFVIPN